MRDTEFYFKLLWLEDQKCVTITCLQDFDEKDYDSNMFIKDEQGKMCIFQYEEDAKLWLNDHIKRELIQPIYRLVPKDIYIKA